MIMVNVWRQTAELIPGDQAWYFTEDIKQVILESATSSGLISASCLEFGQKNPWIINFNSDNSITNVILFLLRFFCQSVG